MANDRSKLLREIPDGVYNAVVYQLVVARTEHPGYRDDELLIKILCERKIADREEEDAKQARKDLDSPDWSAGRSIGED